MTILKPFSDSIILPDDLSQNNSINQTIPFFSTNDIHFYVSSDGEIYLEKVILRNSPNSVGFKFSLKGTDQRG